MDLKSLKTTDEITIPICDPGTDEPLKTETGESITITAKGIDSKLFRTTAFRLAESSGANRKKLSASKVDQNAISLLVAVTTGWSNIVHDGQHLEFNEENVRMIYTEYNWLRQQVDEAIGDRSNFFKKGVTD